MWFCPPMWTVPMPHRWVCEQHEQMSPYERHEIGLQKERWSNYRIAWYLGESDGGKNGLTMASQSMKKVVVNQEQWQKEDRVIFQLVFIAPDVPLSMI